MRTKHIVALSIPMLFCLSVRALACCEGDPPGNPYCYECEDGVWVLKSYAECGKDSDCTRECHSGCLSYCFCGSDDELCSGCESCVLGHCWDDSTNCIGCQWCESGECVDKDMNCSGCESCESGICVDDDDNCRGCEACVSRECVDWDINCEGCESCINSVCTDDDSNCEPAHCDETCIDSYCEVCGADPNQTCCPDDTCYDKCQNTSPTGYCDTSHEDDYKCPYCIVPGCGFGCQYFLMRSYSGNVNHTCLGGCPGECETKPDVYCYTEYRCVEKDVLEDYACAIFPSTDELGCLGPDSYVFCPRCKRNSEDPGTRYYVDQKACK